MSNLIVSVIAVALTAVLVLGSVYYGGGVWSSYHAEAQASRLINEAEQIAGAVSMYSSETMALPENVDTLVDSGHFHEAPAKGVYTKWDIDKGYAINPIGTGTEIRKSCLSARKRWGFDMMKYCTTEEQAGCHPRSDQAPEGCNKHCLRVCYNPEDLNQWNPEINPDDPCCIDNSKDPSILDPVFPSVR